MSLIAGTYTFERQSNFQNYLKELGVPYVLRTLAGIARPVVTVSRDCQTVNDHAANNEDDSLWTIRTVTLFRSHTLSFRLGVAGKDVTMDGRRVEYVIRRTGPNQLVEEQKGSNNTVTKLVRDFKADRMEVSMRANDVAASSVFLRNEDSGNG